MTDNKEGPTPLAPASTTQPKMEQTIGFENLTGSDRAVAETMRRPRHIIYGVTAGCIGLSWFWLVLLGVELEKNTGQLANSPAMAWVATASLYFENLPFGHKIWRFLVSLCLPQGDEIGFAGMFGPAFVMWFLMSIAMMLPSAAPLIRTYADIADVAAAKGDRVVPIIYLVGGYLTVWLVFAFFAALTQTSLVMFGLLQDFSNPAQGIIAGLILLLAGAYQFSSLRYACLEKCRNPFSVLFGQWSSEIRGVFRLGIQQGVFCVGCCWGLMLVMLVVGTMNLAWMAFLLLFTIVEKSGKGKVTSSISGGIFLVWGAATILLSLL